MYIFSITSSVANCSSLSLVAGSNLCFITLASAVVWNSVAHRDSQRGAHNRKRRQQMCAGVVFMRSLIYLHSDVKRVWWKWEETGGGVGKAGEMCALVEVGGWGRVDIYDSVICYLSKFIISNLISFSFCIVLYYYVICFFLPQLRHFFVFMATAARKTMVLPIVYVYYKLFFLFLHFQLWDYFLSPWF
jgi:hypothetical protein